MEVFFREVGVGGFVPDVSAIGADFDAFGPVAACAAGVGPPRHVDAAGVDDGRFIARGDDGGGDGHGLDGEASRISGVVFSELRAEIEVFFALDGRGGRAGDGGDVGEPFHGAGAYVAEDEDANGVAVDSREGLAVHFPC